MWHVLETFRTGVGQDFVFSSGTASDTLASDVTSGMTFADFWLLWIYVVGKSIGRYFSVDELIDRYSGVQITLHRSFMDDEAGVDFGGPVKPHPLEADPGTLNKCRRDGPDVGWGDRWSMPLRSIRISLLHMSRAGGRSCSG